MSADRGREHGSRHRFLAGIGASARGPVVPGPHPPPPATPDVPVIDYANLPTDRSPASLVAAFVASAAEVGARVASLDDLPALVVEHGLRAGVVSDEPAIAPLRAALEAAGVELVPYDRTTAALADVGLTSCVAAVAATGSVVVDSTAAGSRAVSLLPRIHLCAVPRDLVVATPGEVLRNGRPLPSNLVFVTGPSRTGDIEQILTTGVHGPTHVIHVLV